MAENQTYDSCEYFGIHNLCPYREHKLMKEFVPAIDIPESISGTKISMNSAFTMIPEINKMFCHNCVKFKKPEKQE